jgi:hypothetical protein
MDDMAGVITSALIIAVCFAGLHTIVGMRREQARRLGVPYMDKPRAIVLLVVGGLAALYFAFVFTVVALGL